MAVGYIIISSIGILYLILLLFVGRFLAYNDIFRRKIPDESDLIGYTYKKIEFKNKENKILRGWFIKSLTNNSNKTLVLLHGWHRNRSRIINHAKMFVDNGYHVILYDQRSHGESDNGLITFGQGESEDLFSCLAYLKTINEINLSKLGAVGFSLGSGGLIYAASSTTNKKLFKAIILEGAFANSYDTGKYMLQNRFGSFFGYLIGIIFFTLGTKIMSLGKFKHSLPYKRIGLISTTPILVIRGDNDYMVPKESSEKLINSITGTKEVWYNENGNHTDSLITYPDEYRRKVLNFLNKYI